MTVRVFVSLSEIVVMSIIPGLAMFFPATVLLQASGMQPVV